MSVPKPALSQGHEGRDSLLFTVSRSGQENASYLKASLYTDMHACDSAFTAHDRHNVLCNSDAGLFVKRWGHCGRRDISVSRCIGSEVEWPFVSCSGEVEYEKDLSLLVRCFDGQPIPDLGLSLVALRRLSSHLNFAERFQYWACD